MLRGPGAWGDCVCGCGFVTAPWTSISSSWPAYALAGPTATSSPARTPRVVAVRLKVVLGMADSLPGWVAAGTVPANDPLPPLLKSCLMLVGALVPGNGRQGRSGLPVSVPADLRLKEIDSLGS